MCEHCGKEVQGSCIKVHKYVFHTDCFTVFLVALNERRRKQAEADAED